MKALLLGVALAGCAAPRGSDDFLHLPSFSRLSEYAAQDAGSARLSWRGEWDPDDEFRAPMRLTVDGDDATRLWYEFQPYAYEIGRGGRSATGDIVFGVYERFRGQLTGGPGTKSDPLAGFAVGAEVFGVAPQGRRKPPRWPGVVEGEEAAFGVLSVELANRYANYALNLGTGIVGIRGRSGHSGRILAGLGATFALAGTGAGLSTEPSRFGVETQWLRDPAGDRTIGTLQAGLSFWLGSLEMTLGARAGLTSESEDFAAYVGFTTRVFEAFL